ncbi:hypothetical protein N656DRAFT_770379 [Canariomyces notabilis]|uniref:Uncharacterized protein n=1 Tax=Canariomyces notabilis TaxID=2074819 RepID=A0AAN6TA14_9PEZI|nr:hypothetical protein N656DRAFT_770379 [Canariomyces arenarius]
MADHDRVPVPAHLADHEDDDQADQRGYIKGTDYALPYFSRWSRIYEKEVDSGLLRHVNCGYLSTHGVPPTLLALKQHAQSLCVLIHALNPTLNSGEIASGDPKRARLDATGEADPQALKFELNDAFDFLTDLTIPYTNADPNHHKPLHALANEVRGRHEVAGTTYHCPFAETKPRSKGDKQKPYANHHNLIMHANACLERLDHEFSSTGGLLSLLPQTEPETSSTQHESPDLHNARKSLLGQWLLFTQHLVARMHDLERSYGNALDALASDASVPLQHLSTLGPDGRSTGREIAYPQDRWVLVNAGDDVFAHVHDLLDTQEAMVQAKEAIWHRNGVVGEEIWRRERGGEEYARGIVPVNIMTRYYRLAGRGRNTLFVIPAWEAHPGVGYTREVERKPTVVMSVRQPKVPAERASELEKRYDAWVGRMREVERENAELRDEEEAARVRTEALEHENKRLKKANEALNQAIGLDNATLAEETQGQRMRAARAEERVQQLMAEVERLRARVGGEVLTV